MIKKLKADDKKFINFGWRHSYPFRGIVRPDDKRGILTPSLAPNCRITLHITCLVKL